MMRNIFEPDNFPSAADLKEHIGDHGATIFEKDDFEFDALYKCYNSDIYDAKRQALVTEYVRVTELGLQSPVLKNLKKDDFRILLERQDGKSENIFKRAGFKLPQIGNYASESEKFSLLIKHYIRTLNLDDIVVDNIKEKLLAPIGLSTMDAKQQAKFLLDVSEGLLAKRINAIEEGNIKLINGKIIDVLGIILATDDRALWNALDFEGRKQFMILLPGEKNETGAKTGKELELAQKLIKIYMEAIDGKYAAKDFQVLLEYILPEEKLISVEYFQKLLDEFLFTEQPQTKTDQPWMFVQGIAKHILAAKEKFNNDTVIKFAHYAVRACAISNLPLVYLANVTKLIKEKNLPDGKLLEFILDDTVSDKMSIKIGMLQQIGFSILKRANKQPHNITSKQITAIANHDFQEKLDLLFKCEDLYKKLTLEDKKGLFKDIEKQCKVEGRYLSNEDRCKLLKLELDVCDKSKAQEIKKKLALRGDVNAMKEILSDDYRRNTKWLTRAEYTSILALACECNIVLENFDENIFLKLVIEHPEVHSVFFETSQLAKKLTFANFESLLKRNAGQLSPEMWFQFLASKSSDMSSQDKLKQFVEKHKNELIKLAKNSGAATKILFENKNLKNNFTREELDALKRPMVALDVDGTTILDKKLNQKMLDELKKKNIWDIMLFTKMSAEESGIKERGDLVKALERQGFTVHIVVTTLDVLNVVPDLPKGTDFKEYSDIEDKLVQAKKIKDGATLKEFIDAANEGNQTGKRVLGKFVPLANEKFVPTGRMNFDFGHSFKGVERELNENGYVSKDTVKKARIEQRLANGVAANAGYVNKNKTDITKAFLFRMLKANLPPWVNGLGVADDDADTIQRINEELEENDEMPTAALKHTSDKEMQASQYQTWLSGFAPHKYDTEDIEAMFNKVRGQNGNNPYGVFSPMTAPSIPSTDGKTRVPVSHTISDAWEKWQDTEERLRQQHDQGVPIVVEILQEEEKVLRDKLEVWRKDTKNKGNIVCYWGGYAGGTWIIEEHTGGGKRNYRTSLMNTPEIQQILNRGRSQEGDFTEAEIGRKKGEIHKILWQQYTTSREGLIGDTRRAIKHGFAQKYGKPPSIINPFGFFNDLTRKPHTKKHYEEYSVDKKTTPILQAIEKYLNALPNKVSSDTFFKKIKSRVRGFADKPVEQQQAILSNVNAILTTAINKCKRNKFWQDRPNLQYYEHIRDDIINSGENVATFEF